MSPDATVEMIFGINFSGGDEEIVLNLLEAFSFETFKRFPGREELPASDIPSATSPEDAGV